MITVGVGASAGVSADEVLAAVDPVLRAVAVALGRTPAVLPDTCAAPATGERRVRLATLTARAAEPGLRDAAARRGWRLVGHSPAALAEVRVPSPSSRVCEAVGTASVAEAAALLHADTLLVGKTVHGRVTVAVAVAVAE